MKTKLKHLLTLVLITSLLFCGSTTFSSAKSKPNIRLNKKSVTLRVGKTYKLKVKGVKKKVKIKWKSSNKKVVTVNSKGKIKAKKKGKATITAKVKGKKLKCKVVVKAKKKNAKPAKPAKVSTPVQYFTVTFNTNGGTTISSKKVKKGSYVTMPANPKKSGQVFMGWFLDNKGISPFYDDETPITKNLTIYALWADDYSLVDSESITAEDQALLSVSTLEANITEDEPLGFYLESTIVAPYATLYDDDGYYVTTLYDDGDSEDGNDDISGDGVFSGYVYPSEEAYDQEVKTYKAVLEVNGETLESNTTSVYYYEEFYKDEIDVFDYVDEIFNEVMDDDFDGLSLEEKKAAISGALDELTDEGYIFDSYYDENSKSYLFKYSVSGDSNGVVTLEKPESNVKSARGGRDDSRFKKITMDPKNADGSKSASADDKVLNTKVLHNFLNNGTEASDTEQGWVDDYNDCIEDNLGKISNIDSETATTVNSYKKLQNYDLIFINSHGDYIDDDPAICLNERTSPKKTKEYSGDIKQGNVITHRYSSGTFYLIRPGFFTTHYSDKKLDNPIVYLGFCLGYGDEKAIDRDMANAWLNSGADTVFAYRNSVDGGYDTKMLDTITNELAGQSTASKAMEAAKRKHGNNDGSNPPSVMFLQGEGNKKIDHALKNGSFDGMFNAPSLKGWKASGDVRAVYHLGGIFPKSLLGMAVITTGMGSANDETTSTIFQTFRIPDGASTLSFSYDMISEEPMEYYGSDYNDTFIASLFDSTSTSHNISKESVNESTWYGISGINFGGGDDTVFHTRWKTVTYDITPFRGENVTLKFKVYDLTDEIYDSAVVIDNVSVK